MGMGDWNCKIGEGQIEKEVFGLGLGTRNERRLPAKTGSCD